MPVETWKSIADWATIVFIALTVVSGSAAIILGDRINEKQSEQLRKFDVELTGAKTELVNQQLKVEQMARENIQLQAAVEEEKAVRTKLEKSIAPRPSLAFISDHGKTNIDSMKAFAGMEVVLLFPFEERTDAAKLRSILSNAGWKIVGEGYDPNILTKGVTIRRYLSPDVTNRNLKDEQRSEGAANALADFLHSSGWDANVEMGSRGDTPWRVSPNTVQIEIGHKPEPYFDSEEKKRLDEKLAKIKEKMKQIDKPNP